MDRGTWVAQLVKCTPPGFGSGHELRVCEFEPQVGLHADSMKINQWIKLNLKKFCSVMTVKAYNIKLLQIIIENLFFIKGQGI